MDPNPQAFEVRSFAVRSFEVRSFELGGQQPSLE